MVKKLFLKILFLIFFSSSSFACPLLSVDIGTPVRDAQNTFEFLMPINQNYLEKVILQNTRPMQQIIVKTQI